jgi:hypothetical protein
MDDFERDLATALRSAVPAPPTEIDPAEITRMGRRGPARTVAAPLTTALLVAAVVLAVLALVHTGEGRPHQGAAGRSGEVARLLPPSAPLSSDRTSSTRPSATRIPSTANRWLAPR